MTEEKNGGYGFEFGTVERQEKTKEERVDNIGVDLVKLKSTSKLIKEEQTKSSL